MVTNKELIKKCFIADNKIYNMSYIQKEQPKPQREGKEGLTTAKKQNKTTTLCSVVSSEIDIHKVDCTHSNNKPHAHILKRCTLQR